MYNCKCGLGCCNWREIERKKDLEFKEHAIGSPVTKDCVNLEEVEVVRHASWIGPTSDLQFISCSNCGFFMSTIQPRNGMLDVPSLRYCPVCGAKMDADLLITIPEKCDEELLDFVKDSFKAQFGNKSLALIRFYGETKGNLPKYVLIKKVPANLDYGSDQTYSFPDDIKKWYDDTVSRLTQVATMNGYDWHPCVDSFITMYPEKKFEQLVSELGI